MNKLQFLKAVREKTSDLPLHETNHLLEYYAEMIEEAIEEGASEEEAVARLGSWEEICTQIDDFLTSQPIAECPAVKEQTKKEEPINPQKMPRKRISLPMWAVVLLILTSPVWGAVVLSLGIAVFAVVVSLVMTGGALVISLFAVVLCLAAVGIVGIPASFVLLVTSSAAPFLLTIGMSLFCLGCAILGWFLSIAFARFFSTSVRFLYRNIRGCFH